MFDDLTKSCRLDKNLVDLILQILLLLIKNIDVSSLNWARDPFVFSEFESAELSASRR
jgi:hypothetical protein